ncbi:hypothetical protein PU629_02465 [Pullulanibacillus sp. KACC 23026]|nr:hypothetical protein [Pullulanibacillus sp. KACC 23026]WEG13248.1 hypothetical protein PU629_02465 [Pullulanibacillus sp. KACC 23026]
MEPKDPHYNEEYARHLEYAELMNQALKEEKKVKNQEKDGKGNKNEN